VKAISFGNRRLRGCAAWLFAAALLWSPGGAAAATSPAAADSSATAAAARPAQSLAGGSTFHALGPTRILDSRSHLGGAAALQSDVARSFQIGGLFGVPARATAITGTLTIASPTHSGYVSLTPVPASAGSIATSTLNFTTTDPRASGVIVPLGSDGKLWALFHTGRHGDTVQLIFDLSGYFSIDPAGTTFHPLGPVRMFDSASGAGGASALQSDVPAPFRIRGLLGVPDEATAVTGTLSVAGSTKAGYVALTPTEISPGSISTSIVNFPPGGARSTGVTLPLGGDGRIWALLKTGRPGDTVAVTFDLSGYFSADPLGATFHPLGPARILDSRSGMGGATIVPSGAARPLTVVGRFGVPAQATAVAGTFTIASATRAGTISLTPDQSPAARTYTNEFSTVDPRATGVTLPLGGDGRFWAHYETGRSGDSVQVIFDVSGYFAVDAGHGPAPMPAYFNGWQPNDAAPKDSAGVVMVDYGGSVGRQYNPVTIGQAALRYYDRWQFGTGTDDQKAADRTAFFAQVGWLVANQTTDGLWLYHFHWGSQVLPWWSGMAEGLAISGLLRAYSVTGDVSYLPVIARARATFERTQSMRGVATTATVSGKGYVIYQEYMPGYNQNVLNGWMYALVGLYEDAVYLADPMAAFDVAAADRGFAAVAALLPLYDTGSWSYYNLNAFTGTRRGPTASRAYHVVHIGELRFLGGVTGNPILLKYAGRFQSYLDTCSSRGTCPAATQPMAD
jgi:hypothetical protein